MWKPVWSTGQVVSPSFATCGEKREKLGDLTSLVPSSHVVTCIAENRAGTCYKLRCKTKRTLSWFRLLLLLISAFMRNYCTLEWCTARLWRPSGRFQRHNKMRVSSGRLEMLLVEDWGFVKLNQVCLCVCGGGVFFRCTQFSVVQIYWVVLNFILKAPTSVWLGPLLPLVPVCVLVRVHVSRPHGSLKFYARTCTLHAHVHAHTPAPRLGSSLGLFRLVHWNRFYMFIISALVASIDSSVSSVAPHSFP